MKYSLLPFSAAITFLVSIFTVWWSNVQFDKPLADYPYLIATLFGLSYIQLSIVLYMSIGSSRHKVALFVLSAIALIIGVVALVMASMLYGIKHLWE